MADNARYLILIPLLLMVALLPFLSPSQAQAQTATPTPHATPTPMTPPRIHYDTDATLSNINRMIRAMSPMIVVMVSASLGLILIYWAIRALKRMSS
jgi:hypothetical protein